METRELEAGRFWRRGADRRRAPCLWPVLVCLLLAPPLAGSQEEGPAAAGRVEARHLYVAGAGKDVRHLVFTPSAYDAEDDRRWPLIVGLHGTAGAPEQVMEFQRLQELAERYGYLLACPHSSGVGDLARRYVVRVVDDTLEHYRVDPERVYLLGFSRGGGGVWSLGAEHPGRWAGLAPISPATRGDPSPLEGMRDLPVIVVIGDRDTAVSQSAIRRWIQRMAKLGMRHQFVELPGVGHDLSRVNFLPLVFEFFERPGPIHRPGSPGIALRGSSRPEGTR